MTGPTAQTRGAVSSKLQVLIEALRDELQQYGEMLARLDLQQELIVRRASDDLLQIVTQIEAHGLVLLNARSRRNVCQQETSLAFGLPSSAPFRELIPRLPEDYRPLVDALVDENNELLVRVQQRARQNHLLLFRMLELMQKFMNNFLPSGGTPVYNAAGKGLGSGAPSRVLYEAVG